MHQVVLLISLLDCKGGGDLMITDAILNVLMGIINFVLDLLPVIDLTGVMGGIEWFITFLDIAAFFVPIGTIYAIICIIVLEESVKIAISIGRLILKLIPFIG